METNKEYLQRIYTDPRHPGSFTGPKKMKKALDHEGIRNVKKSEILSFLKGQDTYTVNRPARHKFKRNHVITRGINDQLDIDLADVSRLAKYNDGVTFLLTAIDVFSRVALVRPLKNKRSDTVLSALNAILSEHGKVRLIRNDSGSEFKNKQMSAYLNKNNIKQTFAFPPVKAGYIERFNLTLKRSLYAYLHNYNTYRYLEKLPALVYAYNHRPHSSLLGNISPIEVNKSNEAALWNEMYINRPYSKVLKKANIGPFQKKRKKKNVMSAANFKYTVGQLVRVSFNRRTFERSFDQKYSEEIFKVKGRFRKDNIPIYIIQDLQGERISGNFYGPELQAVSKSEKDFYKVEKIIKRRGKGRNQEALVRWMGYPSSFDSWEPFSSVKKLR